MEEGRGRGAHNAFASKLPTPLISPFLRIPVIPCPRDENICELQVLGPTLRAFRRRLKVLITELWPQSYAGVNNDIDVLYERSPFGLGRRNHRSD